MGKKDINCEGINAILSDESWSSDKYCPYSSNEIKENNYSCKHFGPEQLEKGVLKLKCIQGVYAPKGLEKI